MRAAVFQGFGEPLEVKEVERPAVSDEGVVINVDASGICRSDWHNWRGDTGMPLIPGESVIGHEPAGTVVEVGGEVESVQEGDQVAIPFNLADGSCPRCLAGHSNLCENKISPALDLTGAWAEEMTIPYADINVFHLPDNVSTLEMAGLGCRFMTAFHALVHQSDIGGGDWIAVHGCGGVGLSAVDIATALGGNVVAVDIQDEKLETARDLGAEAVINSAEIEDVGPEIHDITDGGAAVSVDALGIEETCRNSILSLDAKGQHLQIGVTDNKEGTLELPTDAMLTNEIEFIGCIGMPPTRVDEMLRMVEHGRLHPQKVISKEVALEDINDRLDAMADFQTEGIEIITQF